MTYFGNRKGRMNMKKKMVDERVALEVNRIYKVGYIILTVGIALDTLLQAWSGRMGEISLRPIELGTFLLAQIVCLVMMIRRGLGDDNQYAEADVFPLRYNVKVGFVSGVIIAVLFIVQRLWSGKLDGVDAVQQAMILAICFVSFVVVTVVGIVLAQYLVFRLAKRQRKKWQDEDE